MTSNLSDFGLKTTLGSPATANCVGKIGSTPGVFENAVNGANVSDAQWSPPSVEYENPHPSLYSQSFHAPASHWPSGLIPSDSSLFADRSFVTSTGVDGVPLGPAASATAVRAATASAARASALPSFLCMNDSLLSWANA